MDSNKLMKNNEQLNDLDKLTAKVLRYIFHNKDNSYSIVKVLSDEDEDHTLVGYIPILSEDVFYDFLGSWIDHDTYGKQFLVTSYSKSENQTEQGVVSYLSSSFFTGIGPVQATRIVRKLGTNAVKKIVEDKTILEQFGMSPIRIEKFHQQLIENLSNEQILTKLYSYNIASKTAMKILNFYGVIAIEKLEADPYQLIYDIDGIGFIKADEIAQKIGITEDDPRRIKASVLYAMKNYSFQNGDTYLTKENLIRYSYAMLKFDFEIDTYLEQLVLDNEIILEDERYYLFDSYHAEVSVAQELIRLENTKSSINNINQINSLLEMVQLQKNITYTDLQKEAIINSLTNKISVITGGPGTGKTTIIDGIIDIYAAYHNLNLANPEISEHIGLMAPTGRAAKRMEQVLNLPAKTIHRQLGYGYDGFFTYDLNKKMPQRLIIIDESSMIDIFLAKKLFEAIDSNAQVIIVGDVDQLPSVSPGTVLKDIIESNVIPVVRLSEIHRQAKNSNIIKLAYKVNEQILDKTTIDSGNDLFLRSSSKDEIRDVIINQIAGALNKGYDMIEDIQVLIPTYRGDIGIDAINELLQKTFNNNKTKFIEHNNLKFYEKDKVIQLVNDPKNFVMNGDIGFIERISKTIDNKDYLVVNFDNNLVTYEKGDLDNLSLAYAMSIHKSQGSEYKIVILPLIRQYIHMLKKELLYTAITRAKDFLIILGDIELLEYAANHLSEQRNSSLKLRLMEIEKE